MNNLKIKIIKVVIWLVIFIIVLLHLWWEAFLFVIFCYLGIYIHEIGHALAGLAVNIPIRKITIGTGRDLFRRKIAGILFVVTKSISGGFTHIGAVSGRFLKVRFIFLYLGGVIAEALAAILIMLLFSINLFELPGIKTISAAHIFIYSSLFWIVRSLIPKKFSVSGVPCANDGLNLIKLLFLKDSELDIYTSAGEIGEALDLYDDKRFYEAELGFKKCIEKYPGLIIPKINLSAVYLKQTQAEEAIRLLESALEDSPEDDKLFMLYNNLACAYLMRNKTVDLQKADEYSLKAIELNNEMPDILNTRGRVLFEKGEIDEGIILLEKTVNMKDQINEKTNKPVNFIALAYGYYLKNEIEEALKYINKFETYRKPLDADDQVFFEYVMGKTNNFNRKQCDREVGQSFENNGGASRLKNHNLELE